LVFAGVARDWYFSGTLSVFPDELPKIQIREWKWHDEFRVLTYIPDSSFEFYGGDSVYKAAAVLPQIPFDVVGGAGLWIKGSLPNLTFHGWQPDIDKFFLNSTVVIRLVPHDAIGSTVRKALAFSRHVIYTYPLPFVLHVEWGNNDQLVQTIMHLYEQHTRRQLKPNFEGRDYALREWDGRHLTRKFATILRSLVSNHLSIES
jgi:hypothetical protein